MDDPLELDFSMELDYCQIQNYFDPLSPQLNVYQNRMVNILIANNTFEELRAHCMSMMAVVVAPGFVSHGVFEVNTASKTPSERWTLNHQKCH